MLNPKKAAINQCASFHGELGEIRVTCILFINSISSVANLCLTESPGLGNR